MLRRSPRRSRTPTRPRPISTRPRPTPTRRRPTPIRTPRTPTSSWRPATSRPRTAIRPPPTGSSRTRRTARPAARAHDASRDERDAVTQVRGATAILRSQSAAQRLASADRRDEAARARDLIAAARDRNAEAREAAAAARDRAALERERRALESGNLDEALEALRAVRLSGISLRERSAQERAAAAADRAHAATDRAKAAEDRRHAGVDELTGIFRRGTGELALTHEIARSRRLGRPLILALTDVDALKSVNDAAGHAAGDALLRDVATAITSALREYDVAVRWGGDEFVCALSDTSIDVATERMAEIQHALAARPGGPSISYGLAELTATDSVDTLVARADAALYMAKAERAT
jgi:diguanylate cyclase (GGDEF)-like protein